MKQRPILFVCRPWQASDGLPMMPIVSAMHDKADEAKPEPVGPSPKGGESAAEGGKP